MIGKKILVILPLLLLLNLTFAQEPKISISLSGFGKIGEVFITIHNTGETNITDLDISIDGEYLKTIKGKSSPGKGFEILLNLIPGEHTIEVKSAEGAYDSLTLDVPELKTGDFKIDEQNISSLEKNKTLIIAVIVLLFVIFVWLLVKPPKLKLD